MIKRLLEVLLKQNSRLNYSRFSTEFTLKLIQTISKIGSPDGSAPGEDWLSWSSETHNLVATQDSSLGVDSDDPVPIRSSLPRFLSHPSLRVRLETTRLLLKDAGFNPRDFSGTVLSPVLDDLFQVVTSCK